MSAVQIERKSAAVPSLAQARKLTRDELHALYRRGATLTSYGIKCMAVAYCTMRDRGDDVSMFQHGLVKFFDRIVSGRVLPELLLEYAGAPQHIEQISRLVPEEQRKLLGRDATVQVSRQAGTGEIETRAKHPAACSISELLLVIGEGKIRTPAEQKHYLTPPPKDAPLPARAPLPATDDVDVWHSLTVVQRNAVAAQADRFGITVAVYLRNMLINQKVINGKVTVREKEFA